MKRTIGIALASGLALLVAGCATGGGGGGAPAGGGESVSTPSGATTTASAGPTIRDFNLQVRCPGIHQGKIKNWSDDEIMSHFNVTKDEIAACEAWQAAQPKGYVPPPPGGAPAAGAAGQQAQSGSSTAPH